MSLPELLQYLTPTEYPIAAASPPHLIPPAAPLPGREAFPWWGGVEFAAASPFCVQAIAPGQVIHTGNETVLLHEYNILSRYRWQGKQTVHPGQTIRAGHCLGEANGGSLHLTFGLTLYAPHDDIDHFMPLDPRPWLISKGITQSSALTAHSSLWRGELPLTSIPLFLRRTMVAVEDRRFFQHPGIDVRRMIGALRANLRHRRIMEGASTITQQAVRSALHITRRGILRKLVEIPIALILERFLSKEDILELYFNSIYWGRGATTVAAAAVDFFGKNVWQLNLKECLVLAALPNHPLRWDITPQDVQRLERKVAICLTLLEQQRVIDNTIVALARQQTYQLIETGKLRD